MDIKAVFEKYDDEYLKFARIENNSISQRPDVFAFILLDMIVSPKPNRLGTINDMVAGAGHDEIWLDVNIEELAAKAKEHQIRDLIRCGVRISSEEDSLVMFV